MSLYEYLDQRERELHREIEVLNGQIAERERELDDIEVTRKALGIEEDKPEPLSPAERLSMRIMVTRTLKERFPNGATITEIIEHIKDTWHRDIDRNNLSPLLSRLYQQGNLGRIMSTRGWFLIELEQHIQGFHPYLDRRAGRIVWCQPATATDKDIYEPLRIYGRGASE
jgi:hypothetical protein